MIRLNRAQLKKLTDISADLGIVISGFAIVPVFFGNHNTGLLTTGIAVALSFWLFSLILLIGKN